MYKILISIISLVVIFSGRICLAETVYLNNSQTVSDNATVGSNINEIAQQGEIFTSPYGFKFQYPTGWHSQDYKGSPLFTKQAGAGISFPCLALSMDRLPTGMQSAMEFAQLVLPDYQAGAKGNGGVFRIVEPIHEIEVGGIKGARFVYERTSPDGRNMKSVDCKFLVGNGQILSLQGIDTINGFDQSTSIFGKAISSFKLTDQALNTKTLRGAEYQRKPSNDLVPQPTISPVQVESGSELYVNEEYGFEIKPPKGWSKQIISGKDIIFSKGGASYPALRVTMDIAPLKIRSAYDFANLAISQYQALIKSKGGSFKLIRPLERVLLENGAEGAVCMFEIAQPDQTTKSIDCKFMKGNIVISLQGIDYSDTFNRSQEYFMDTIGTFKFRGDKVSLTAEGTRIFKLKDLLATGTKKQGDYINQEPSFLLNIPLNSRRRWHFVVFDNPATPFYISNEKIEGGESLPFISSMVSLLSGEYKGKSPELIFRDISVKHETWEKEISLKRSKGEIKVVNKGNPLTINGLDAFERVIETPFGMLHVVYILLDNSLIQFGLNTSVVDFGEDDKEFMGIIKTMRRKSG
ncbi:MAG: hypothetical protein ABIH27_07950 [Candidatus Omnitrophota bacterium]